MVEKIVIANIISNILHIYSLFLSPFDKSNKLLEDIRCNDFIMNKRVLWSKKALKHDKIIVMHALSGLLLYVMT